MANIVCRVVWRFHFYSRVHIAYAILAKSSVTVYSFSPLAHYDSIAVARAHREIKWKFAMHFVH